jgi:hypothetical protein
MARGVPTKPDTAHLRARIAGLSRAMRNGERPPDDTELDDCRRELAAIRLTQYVEATIANWPQLPDEELDRIAAPLRTGSRAGDGGA